MSRAWSVLSACLVLSAGLALFVAAGTRAIGALEARPARPAVLALGRGQVPDDDVLATGVEALERATAGQNRDPDAYGDLALLNLERARRELANPELALAEIEAAAAAQRAGLALAPARGSGWARLVYAEELRAEKRRALRAWALEPDAAAPPGDDGAAALEALEMAFLTRDLSFSLVRFRLGAALARWAELPPWLHGVARGEVLELTRYGRRGTDALIDFYLAPPGPETVAIIDEELAADPKQQAHFAKRLERRLARRR